MSTFRFVAPSFLVFSVLSVYLLAFVCLGNAVPAKEDRCDDVKKLVTPQLEKKETSANRTRELVIKVEELVNKSRSGCAEEIVKEWLQSSNVQHLIANPDGSLSESKISNLVLNGLISVANNGSFIMQTSEDDHDRFLALPLTLPACAIGLVLAQYWGCIFLAILF